MKIKDFLVRTSYKIPTRAYTTQINCTCPTCVSSVAMGFALEAVTDGMVVNNQPLMKENEAEEVAVASAMYGAVMASWAVEKTKEEFLKQAEEYWEGFLALATEDEDVTQAMDAKQGKRLH